MRAIGIATALLLAVSVTVSAADWPQFLGPKRDVTSTETGLLDQWPDSGPPLLWWKRIGTGYSAPSVQGDRLVLHHRLAEEEVVECFNAQDGKRIWRRSYPSGFVDPYGYNNGPRATPLLTGTRCYAFGAEGKLLCLDRSSGRLVWERDTGTDWEVPEAFFGVGSSPVLAGDRLLVMVGGQPNAGMVALDARTGATLWESVGETTWTGLPKLGWRGEPSVVWKDWAKQASYATPVIRALTTVE